MEQLIEEAEEVIQYIDDWEPSDEEDDLDEEELWEPVIRHMSRVSGSDIGSFFWSKRQRKRGMVRENQINEWKRHFEDSITARLPGFRKKTASFTGTVCSFKK